jgi:DNA repair exonuclease SbcCD ATPase subunit
MKQVILKSITLCNFKGEKERTTNFNVDVTTISGDNGMGKSRHFDAFIWLLFGKDTQDRKDYEVKTRINGQELHNVECSVSGVIVVDGEEITLKRSFVEDWVKPRGKVDRVFKGNHTECWWNETPVNVSEYTKRVETIIDSSVFKMITNPAFFVNMNWKLQREQLFQLAGTITDAEIASQNPDFAKLLDKISGKSLADFKKELSARKKRLQDELNQIQPRIDQTHKMMPETEDFNAIEKEIQEIDHEISEIDKAIADVTAAIRKQYEGEQEKQNKVNALKSECQKIVFDAKTKAQDEAFAANAERREIESKIKAKERDVELTDREIASGESQVSKTQNEIEQIKASQDKLRESWFAENAKTYNGETVCPHCGQPLPDEMIENARELFTKAQSEKCDEITAKGQEYGRKVDELNKRVDEIENDIANAKKTKESLFRDIEALKAKFATIPVIEVADVAPESIPEWVAKQKEIADIEATISTDNSNVNTDELQKQKAECNTKRAALVERYSKRHTIVRCETEIANLESRGKELAQMIADAEREEYTIEQFTRTKVDECENRINAMFKVVSFRLFYYTIDGNAVETCIPTIGGVPYGSANTASKINAGLDIINTLCKFYGVCAPIFIDNRESVNEIVETESQIINLVVTRDKFLTIK